MFESIHHLNPFKTSFNENRCSHCVRFAPTYEQIAQQLHSQQKTANPNSRQVNVAKVDGAAERALSSRFSVKGFPSFYLIDGWTVREYDGNRSQENLIKFAMEDYENTEPVPFLFGPFGPMGQARSLLMRSGTAVVGVYEGLIEERKMSPLMAMSVLCAVFMGAGLVMIVVLGVLCMPKPKSD
jgi:thiol-disulfide isomerase/thioredoxin